MFCKIIFSLLLSQIFFLGVFGIERTDYFVIEEKKEICGVFTPGTFEIPNWLPNTWSANICTSGNFKRCCEESGFLYVGKVGDPKISLQRSAAEFLAEKGIIESHSLSPNKYELQNTITRKEMMKIIGNISQIELNEKCAGIFQDVENDWGCKYIESALSEGFIAQNENFRPDETLTQAEALKLIFQARGLERRYNTNSWQQDYISSAYYLGYIDEKPTYFNTAATRGWLFLATGRSYENF